MVESASVALGLRLTTPWTWDTLTRAPGTASRSGCAARCGTRPRPTTGTSSRSPWPVSWNPWDGATPRPRRDRPRARPAGRLVPGAGLVRRRRRPRVRPLQRLGPAHLSAAARPPRRGPGPAGPSRPAAAEFLDGFALLFDANGAPIHHGRSLTYRFAAGAAVALGALTGHTPLAPGRHPPPPQRRAPPLPRPRGAHRGRVLGLGWYGPHEATSSATPDPPRPTGRRRDSSPAAPGRPSGVDGHRGGRPGRRARPGARAARARAARPDHRGGRPGAAAQPRQLQGAPLGGGAAPRRPSLRAARLLHPHRPHQRRQRPRQPHRRPWSAAGSNCGSTAP
jgi:hypothetical protein